MTSARLARLALPTLAVVLLGGVAGWLPARSATAEAEGRTDAALRVVDDLSWEIEDLEELAPSRAELAAEAARFAAAIPDDHRLAEFILELEGLAATLDVDIVDVVPTAILGSFDDLATPPGTSSVVVAVALSGSYAGTIEFLDGLNQLSRLVVAEAIAVGFDEVSATLAIDLELRVFTTEELVEFTDEFLDLDEDDSDDIDGDGLG